MFNIYDPPKDEMRKVTQDDVEIMQINSLRLHVLRKIASRVNFNKSLEFETLMKINNILGKEYK